ncbi:SDR family NAD(P)-dependent oxidoreductase [Actinomadura macrotermitis]|uniref:3-phenylpropionate-dihydrodiol/cinnamic acid-dihydrodiol dehydrogenase n=1 Tax=Actinomadura macrotermitis TaxID=2585200 RepID=A0A7K0C0B8_9ACTN|nr:SDR family NAD(P)-dependent oxidoreductase [Actinomadura macrotermitis]MQY06903.1 3-phenylpropionate-dihydrodiol/cinnamic acid-dihydrodiol dehydrogenase [Actinomadura macrotermitis]
MRELTGRVAVVTGAGSGIGRALALRFAAEGMRVALADVQPDALEETRRALAGAVPAGTGTIAQVTDVGDEASVQALADRVYDGFGAVHLLCNNAGVFAGGQMWSRPAADFEWVLRVNLWGILHGVRAFVPRMLDQDSEGHVVNTCSVAGLFAAPFTGPYTVSKFAAYAATETLAHEFAMTGAKLRASALCPGGVATGIHRSGRNRPDALAADPTDDQRFIDTVIADTVADGIEPAAVADAVVDAVRAERFLVLTHPSYAAGLSGRAAALAEGALPGLPDFESRG